MGITTSAFLRWTLFLSCAAGVLSAAPKLRLVSTTVGPISIAQGANGTTQTVEAYNVGDGSLNLSATATATWLGATVGAARDCSNQSGSCIPVQVALRTSSLAKGIYTATLVISDGNAIDAPQTVTVTVQVGGGVPDRVSLYVAPNGSSDSVRFTTNNNVALQTNAQTGGDWLTASVEGSGSFRFVLPYTIRGTHQDGMAAGSYQGSVIVSNSGLAADNKTVPVTLTVTSQPIITTSPEVLRVRVAQGGPKQLTYITLGNRGLGTLSITGVTSAVTSGSGWLAAERLAGYNLASVTVTPGSAAAGLYQGSVTIASNAANGTQTVPVEMEVVAAGAPFAYFQGAVNNATFAADEPVAQGGLVAVFGEQFLNSDSLTPPPPGLPLPTSLGGTQVLVNGTPAPLFYAAYGQLNFQIPYATTVGEAQIQVVRSGSNGNKITVQVAARQPRLMRLGVENYAIAVNQDGSFPVPTRLGIGRPAKIGDTLVFYALGLGPTSPAATTGAAAPSTEPFARVADAVVLFGASSISEGTAVVPGFIGLTPGFVGLYQINVRIPEEAPKSDRVPVRFSVGNEFSLPADIAIQ